MALTLTLRSQLSVDPGKSTPSLRAHGNGSPPISEGPLHMTPLRCSYSMTSIPTTLTTTPCPRSFAWNRLKVLTPLGPTKAMSTSASLPYRWIVLGKIRALIRLVRRIPSLKVRLVSTCKSTRPTWLTSLLATSSSPGTSLSEAKNRAQLVFPPNPVSPSLMICLKLLISK